MRADSIPAAGPPVGQRGVIAGILRGVRWLALDVGSRRVGVALSDEGETVVTPLSAVPWRGPASLAETVASLVARWAADGVVVGRPTTRRGGGRGEVRVAAVVAALERRVSAPVVTVDERGTTGIAQAQLAESGIPRRRWPELVDSLAAKAILDTWLESRRRSSGDGSTCR